MVLWGDSCALCKRLGKVWKGNGLMDLALLDSMVQKDVFIELEGFITAKLVCYFPLALCFCFCWNMFQRLRANGMMNSCKSGRSDSGRHWQRDRRNKKTVYTPVYEHSKEKFSVSIGSTSSIFHSLLPY